MKSILWLLIGSLLLGRAVGAAEFHLRDNSVVYGTILSLVDGNDLVVDTAHMGEVTLEWDSILEIRNTEVIDVELFDGRRLLGKLSRDGNDISIDGETIIRISAEDVFNIDEYNETIWEGFSADANLGMNIVRGNSEVTQLSIGAGAGYDYDNFEVSLRGTTMLNEQAGSGDTRRSTLNGSYTRRFSRGWQAIGSLQVEADEQQQLDSRALLSLGYGKKLYNDRTHRLELYGGMAINSERFSGLPQNETLEALILTRYRMRSFADIDVALVVLPSLEQDDRLRAQTDASVSFDLNSDLSFHTAVYHRYDNQPPLNNQNNDLGVTLGLSWSY